MIYVDTNVFVFAIENHPRYGASVRRFSKTFRRVDSRQPALCSSWSS